MLLDRKYHIPDKFIWIIAAICLTPLLLNVFGYDFGFIQGTIDPYLATEFTQVEKSDGIREILHGRYVHLIFVSVSIVIAYLTAFLAIVDYKINKEITTPIVGTALLCSGLFETFHLLVSTNLIKFEAQNYFFTSYTWFFSRVFHAGILILGSGLFLMINTSKHESVARKYRRSIITIALLFVVLTFCLIAFLVYKQQGAAFAYPFRNISKSFDLLPLLMYVFLAAVLLPRFYSRYPSTFSKTLLLSTIPAIVCQLYMTFGSIELYDNSFNISHFMMAFAYFIPFTGLVLNYIETHRNEKNIISLLHQEFKERKETENILTGILSSSLSSILALESVKNVSGKIDDYLIKIANPSTAGIFNLSSQNITNKFLFEEIPILKEENWKENLMQVLDSGENKSIEYYSSNLNKWLYVIIVPLLNGLAVTTSDISKRKNALQQLMNAEKIAVGGRIARMIAHEVRNPLTNINLSVDQIKSEHSNDKDELLQYLNIIERNSKRINQLISELLLSSKPSHLNFQKSILNKIVREAIELSKDRAKLKNVLIEYVEGSPDQIITVDRDKIRIAILNLLINAIEAVEQGDGKIRISSSINATELSLIIEDNGPGIKKEVMERMYEPFNTDKVKGMGLGLTSVQNTIMSHGGEIRVESKSGAGTKFYISIPIGIRETEISDEDES